MGTLTSDRRRVEQILPKLLGNAAKFTERGDVSPALRGVPIVAVTSYAMVGNRERGLAAGCTGYIGKPINTARGRGPHYEPASSPLRTGEDRRVLIAN